ncbi:unnamed protein product [Symbiodinium natans]|uniref:Uncharacterized protein n=1 Tax=Symbiodinium natans TaxID=878477 RepID=A0A812UII0_9DINO|nr:unnamed protein product [Symbiodinium natans]
MYQLQSRDSGHGAALPRVQSLRGPAAEPACAEGQGVAKADHPPPEGCAARVEGLQDARRAHLRSPSPCRCPARDATPDAVRVKDTLDRLEGAGDILFSLANDCPEDLLFGDSKELDKEPMEFARIVSAVASGKGGGKGKGNPAPGQVPPGQMPGYGQAPGYGCPPGPLPGYGQMPQTQMPGAGQVPYAQMPPPGHMPHMPPGIIQPAYTKAAANPPFVDESNAGSRMPNLPPAGASTPTPASAQANLGMPNVTGLMDMAGKGVKSLWQQGADSTTKP